MAISMEQLNNYILEVRERDMLERELEHTINTMRGIYRVYRDEIWEDRDTFHAKEVRANQLFRALLREKARQEQLQNVSNHNGSATKDSRPRPTHNPPARICIRHVLKEEVTGHA